MLATWQLSWKLYEVAYYHCTSSRLPVE